MILNTHQALNTQRNVAALPSMQGFQVQLKWTSTPANSDHVVWSLIVASGSCSDQSLYIPL